MIFVCTDRKNNQFSECVQGANKADFQREVQNKFFDRGFSAETVETVDFRLHAPRSLRWSGGVNEHSYREEFCLHAICRRHGSFAGLKTRCCVTQYVAQR
jgi:hypothetical protein